MIISTCVSSMRYVSWSETEGEEEKIIFVTTTRPKRREKDSKDGSLSKDEETQRRRSRKRTRTKRKGGQNQKFYTRRSNLQENILHPFSLNERKRVNKACNAWRKRMTEQQQLLLLNELSSHSISSWSSSWCCFLWKERNSFCKETFSKNSFAATFSREEQHWLIDWLHPSQSLHWEVSRHWYYDAIILILFVMEKVVVVILPLLSMLQSSSKV